jgi:hypothetical protein
MEGQVPVFISPKIKIAQLYPRALAVTSKIRRYSYMYIVNIHVNICVHSFHRNYTRFRAYPNYIRMQMFLKKH